MVWRQPSQRGAFFGRAAPRRGEGRGPSGLQRARVAVGHRRSPLDPPAQDGVAVGDGALHPGGEGTVHNGEGVAGGAADLSRGDGGQDTRVLRP